MPADLTIAIVGRNAATTVAHAVRCAAASPQAAVLLVDDFSEDGMAALAQAAAPGRVRVVRPDRWRGVGHARQTALQAIETSYGLWLDADDAFDPGYAEAMAAALQAGADMVYAASDLYDQGSGDKTVDRPMPTFLQRPGGLWRQFERNWVSGPFCGFRTDFAVRLGMDPDQRQAEDYDFSLRALVCGARIALMDRPRYRYVHSAQSLSRDLTQARHFTHRALAKHEAAWLGGALQRSGLAAAEQLFTLTAFLLTMDRAAAAASVASDLAAAGDEPIAPYARPAGWMGRFLSATAQMLLQRFDTAGDTLAMLQATAPAAEIDNNLAVCCWHRAQAAQAAQAARAQDHLQRALAQRPHYVDARANLDSLQRGYAPTRITRLPLRPLPSRDVYRAAAPG
ncbi:MAG: glycosyltransferase family 2 protein [Rhodothalassiaceae bacterium]